MKTFIVTVLTVLVITSCQEEEVRPVDPFVGSWGLENPDLALQVTFDVIEDGDELSFENINIEYPEITEPLDYRMKPFGRFAVNTGYEEIKISGRRSGWSPLRGLKTLADLRKEVAEMYAVRIIMIHNRIHLKTQDMLEVYTMEIHMINRETIILQDQVFTRID